MEGKKTILSGIRATGKLHLGNYLGAMKDFVELSKSPKNQCYFFVANLHTITTKIDPKEIMSDLKEIVIDYLSVGVNLNNATIFAQSSVPETCELAWLLNCLANVAELERLPHYKEKKKKEKEKEKESTSFGLLAYPILMAADILGPCADFVPVGEDQHPHIELARELARRFNNTFGETFSIPKRLEQKAIRVPGLDGTGKMGKSDNNTIDLSDSPTMVEKKLLGAVTDTNRIRRSDPGNPNKCNVYGLHTLLSHNEEIKEVFYGCTSASMGCVDCKKILTKNVNSVLGPIQQKRAEITSSGNDIAESILKEGGEKARARIAPKVEEAKDKMGVPFYR